MTPPRQKRRPDVAGDGAAMSKKSEAYIALENAARMALAAGVEWSTARNAVAKQYGAVFREGAIDGWTKPKIVYGNVEVSDEDLENAEWVVVKDGKETPIENPSKKRKEKRR